MDELCLAIGLQNGLENAYDQASAGIEHPAIGENYMMSRTLMLLASAAVLAVPLAMPASAQLLQHKDLSLPIALAIANGALDACKAMGYAASVVVVNRDGDTLVSL